MRRLPDAKLLRNDCTVLNNASVRFMLEVCARDNYSPDSPAAQFALRGLLQRLCDNKPVEDLQSGPAVRIQKHANQRCTTSEIQERITSSNIFSSRKIKHSSSVTRQQYIAEYSKVRPPGKHRYDCRKHKFKDLSWTRVMGIKRWVSRVVYSCR